MLIKSALWYFIVLVILCGAIAIQWTRYGKSQTYTQVWAGSCQFTSIDYDPNNRRIDTIHITCDDKVNEKYDAYFLDEDETAKVLLAKPELFHTPLKCMIKEGDYNQQYSISCEM